MFDHVCIHKLLITTRTHNAPLIFVACLDESVNIALIHMHCKANDRPMCGTLSKSASNGDEMAEVHRVHGSEEKTSP